MFAADRRLADVLARAAPAAVRQARGLPARPCSLCGAAGAPAICRSSSPPGLTVHLCGACGVYFTAGSATAPLARDHYGESFWPEEARRVAGTFVDRCARERADHLQRHLGRDLAGLRVLEVGAGRGELARELLGRGARLQGIEPDGRVAAALAAELSIPVFAGLLQDFRSGPGEPPFDVVTLSHVLEHLADPVAALVQIRGWLAPAGVLALEVPNADVLAHGRLESFFFDEWTHLFHFGKRTLVRVAAAAGFALTGVEEVFTNHWGDRTALRTLAVPTAAAPLGRADDDEATVTLRRALTEQLLWTVARRPARAVRHEVGVLLRRVLPAPVVDGLRRRLF